MAILTLLLATPANAQRYEMTVFAFPDPPTNAREFDYARPEAINNHGLIVGYVRNPYNDRRAALWRTDGRIILLPALPDTGSNPHASAYDINDDDIIVGVSDPIRQGFGQQAVIWPDPQTAKPVIDCDSAATHINNTLNVVGFFAVAFLDTEPFFWNGGDWFSLYPPMKYESDLNNNNQVVGSSRDWTPYLWDNGEFTVLPALVPGADASAASINDHGVVCGASTKNDDVGYPVIWENAHVREMPALVPHRDAGMVAINNQGVAIGSCEVGSYDYRSVLWRNNLATQLNDLLLPLDPNQPDWTLAAAVDINDRGQIAGSAHVVNRPGFYVARLDPIDTGLTLWSIQPSDPGQRNTIEIHHATPGGRVTLLWGHTRSDPTPLEQCHDAMIDVTDPRIAGSAIADQNGTALINVNVPPQTDGLFILQAIDHATCEVSPPSMCLFRVAR